MLLTRYAPFRRSPPGIATRDAPRLACVKPAASVHPEPGSNSSLYISYFSKLVPTLFKFPKKLTLSIHCSRYFVVLSFSLFKDLLVKNPARCPNGIAKVTLFFKLPKKTINFFTFF